MFKYFLEMAGDVIAEVRSRFPESLETHGQK